jgi:predicted nucleic acid-binding protein
VIVVDASACVHLLQADHPDPDLVQTMRRAGSLHAPALLDVEFLSALRGPVLRDNLTVYDAAYVALAEALGCALVTTDAKLRSACGHQAVVEVYPLTPLG